jgi:flagellin-like protein
MLKERMGNMKANRKFVNGEEAVSAVIGVILMVAITVAIAATVYVYVSGMLTPGAAKTPDIAFMQDDTAKTLTVTKVSQNNVNWTNDIVITGTGTKPVKLMAAGDRIINCAGVVSVSWKGQTLLGSWTFT